MGFSLSVHIILAVLGIIFPLIIMLAEFIGVRYKDKYYITLSKRLTTAFIVLFAVGTTSGMLVAMNLFFLWPTFIALVGKVAILPVYLEVFAFFTESIFLAIYIYSEKLFGSTYWHVLLMGIVALGAVMSAVLITVLNAFMNTPVGFNISTYLKSGVITGLNPLAVFTSPSASMEIFHVVATSYFAGAAIMLAYFSYRLIKSKLGKERLYYKKAVNLVFAIAIVAVGFSIYTGIRSIEQLRTIQPEKYAAIELDMFPRSNAPEIIGGIYTNNTIKDAIVVPGLQSYLIGNSSIVTPGLSQYPEDTWPPLIVHDMFDFMVLFGALIGFAYLIVLGLSFLKKISLDNKLVLTVFIICGFLGAILLENGWLVDEFGRQPWIIYNVMLVSQAGNTSPSIIPIAIAIVVLYAMLIPITLIVLRKIFANRPLSKEL
jgi:cytochrome bd ubiquinol oxidase subunit I